MQNTSMMRSDETHPVYMEKPRRALSVEEGCLSCKLSFCVCDVLVTSSSCKALVAVDVGIKSLSRSTVTCALSVRKCTLFSAVSTEQPMESVLVPASRVPLIRQ